MHHMGNIFYNYPKMGFLPSDMLTQYLPASGIEYPASCFYKLVLHPRLTNINARVIMCHNIS